MLSAFVSVAHAAMWRGKNLRRAATVVRKGGKNLVKVENKHTFDQELRARKNMAKCWKESSFKKASVFVLTHF